MDVITFPVNLQTTSGLLILLHDALYHSKTRRHVIKLFLLKLIVDKSLSCIFYRKVCKVAGGANRKKT